MHVLPVFSIFLCEPLAGDRPFGYKTSLLNHVPVVLDMAVVQNERKILVRSKSFANYFRLVALLRR